MKKIIFKSLFCFMFIFSIFTLANTCFCDTAKGTDMYYFEKPDSWTGSKIYFNLIDSTTNTTAFAEPGKEIPKVLDKFKIPNIFSLNGNLYKVAMTSEFVSAGNFDKIIFSNSNDGKTIINQTTPIDIHHNLIYTVTGGTGTSQDATASTPFYISSVTKIQRFAEDLKKINPSLDQNILDNLEKIITNLQKIIVDLYDFDLSDDLLIPLQEVDKYLEKSEGKYDELNQKIEETKDAIKDKDTTQDNVKKLEEIIKEAENIKDNYDYFTNNQVNDIINKLDEGIKNLLPDTSKLEEILEVAKKIDIAKYTDESVKVLSDAISNAEAALKDTSKLTTDKINELISSLNDAMNKLIEKTIKNENTNPATGDILYIIIPVLVVAILAILFTVVYSKKKKQSQSK